MSRYGLQRCLFDHLRRLEDPDDDRGPGDVLIAGYDLDEAEAAAARDGDVAAFHDLGVHPVLINGFCRANGWKRADYRRLFRPDQAAAATGRSPRWLTS